MTIEIVGFVCLRQQKLSVGFIPFFLIVKGETEQN